MFSQSMQKNDRIRVSPVTTPDEITIQAVASNGTWDHSVTG